MRAEMIFKVIFADFLTRIIVWHVHFSKLLHIMASAADLRGLIRMTGVRPCPCGHSSTLEGPWSTCATEPALPQNVAARLFPWTCHGVAFLPRCSVSPESAAQQSEVKLGDWCAGCVVACPTPSVSDMLLEQVSTF